VTRHRVLMRSRNDRGAQTRRDHGKDRVAGVDLDAAARFDRKPRDIARSDAPADGVAVVANPLERLQQILDAPATGIGRCDSDEGLAT
jgi:hypothetical protein